MDLLLEEINRKRKILEENEVTNVKLCIRKSNNM